MAKRHEVSEEEWAILDLVIPKSTATTGRPARDRREMLNGVLWILCTGSQWRDLPERFGPWETVYSTFRTWRKSGVNADRYWIVALDGDTLRTQFGGIRAGWRESSGQVRVKEFRDRDRAAAAFLRAIADEQAEVP